MVVESIKSMLKSRMGPGFDSHIAVSAGCDEESYRLRPEEARKDQEASQVLLV